MTLGRLEKVDLRGPWPTEAQHFTPWLAGEENLALLSETLNIDLEVEAVEQSVGPFRADILCKDTASDKWVLIENQLERTDHTHLGQLMTYAAGLDAVTIVWIAARFADEHRAAMDWLNDITDSHVRFFGLEVELWRIGTSPSAPKFNIVCKPNDWARTATAAKRAVEEGALSPTRQLQQKYWDQAQNLLAQSDGPVRPVSAPAQSWLSHGIGKTGVTVGMSMNTRDKWIRAEVYFSGKWAKHHFDQIRAKEDAIEAELGAPLDWQPLPDKQDARVCFNLNADPTNEADWPRQHAWLVKTINQLHRVFSPHISRLQNEQSREQNS